MKEQLRKIVRTGFAVPWDIRRGRVVPSTTDVALKGGGVEISAAIMYADLAESSWLAEAVARRVAARVLKAFLTCATVVVRKSGGSIRSFDGDRVMGVFVGEDKEVEAVTAAFRLRSAMLEIIGPEMKAKYTSIEEQKVRIAHGVGIDTGVVLAVRAGRRNANDLIWVGRPANAAAHLSERREHPYTTFITSRVYSVLPDDWKWGGEDGDRPIWERDRDEWLGEGVYVYRSKWGYGL